MLPISIVLAQNLSGAFMAIGMRRLAIHVPQAQFQVAAAVISVMYVLTVPFVVALGGVQLQALTAWWPHLLVAGLALTLNPILFYVALRFMDAAMASLLATVNIVVAILGAVWILGERLTIFQVLGALVVIAGVVYALSAKLTRKQRRHWLAGTCFTLLSGVCLATSMILEKYLLDHMTAQSFIVWGWGLQTLIALMLGVCISGHLFKKVIQRKHLMPLMGTGLAKAGTAGAFVASLLVFKSLSMAIVLAGLRPLFVSLLGWVMLGEHHFLRRKLIASCIAGFGVALMFWR